MDPTMVRTHTHTPTTPEKSMTFSGEAINTLAKESSGETRRDTNKEYIGTKSTHKIFGLSMTHLLLMARDATQPTTALGKNWPTLKKEGKKMKNKNRKNHQTMNDYT